MMDLIERMEFTLRSKQEERSKHIQAGNYGNAHELDIWCEAYEGAINSFKRQLAEEGKQ